MTGRIIKGVGGFYYVDVEDAGVFECHAKGLFREQGIKPLVGDKVCIEQVADENDLIGSITEVLPRKNSLIRPEVANADGAMIVFAMRNPDANLRLTDAFIIQMSMQEIPVTLLFNKKDLEDEDGIAAFLDAYENSGAKCLAVSAQDTGDTSMIYDMLSEGVTILAGPSGVGKSTLLNALCPDAEMETGEISRKSRRGKHTTRHSELFKVKGKKDTYRMDTPGFTSFSVPDMDAESLKAFYPEFYPYEGKCKFAACSHTHEPGCAVKDAAAGGSISAVRYGNYCALYEELKNRKRY
jgi:ribosome biogenesis GTPase